MAMPQVHIVADCTGLGFGPARGAQMLSLMRACGIVSRLVFGLVCDRIGGIPTLLLGYVVSAMSGLLQGGIVPTYAIIVHEHVTPQQASTRVGAVIMATLVGMALGGWLSGWIVDLTGSYHAAFINGIGWNLLNLSIVFGLCTRVRTVRQGPASVAPAGKA